MTRMKELQMKLERLAEKRKFWRDMRNAVIAPQTRDLMMGYKSRIQAKMDSYVEKYDNALPDDSLTIAKAQEGRRVCHEILLELDENVCQKAIDELDAKVKVLNNEIETLAENSRTEKGGFEILSK